jgi:hypothetical protein
VNWSDDAPMTDDTADDMAARISRFAEEARSSPLYQHLATGLALRPQVAALLGEAPVAQRAPTLLFAAIHDLVLSGIDHELANWYPSVMGTRALAPVGPPESSAAVEAFVDVCGVHRDEIVTTMRTRATQTNETGRVAATYPALSLITRTGGPIALIELGASAGLNLQLDRFRIELRHPGAPGGMVIGGDADSPVVIVSSCERGAVPPVRPLQIVSRTGIDLEPVDLRDPVAVRWLQACVWPDETARMDRLRRAVELCRVDPAPVVRGDMLDAVTATVASAVQHGGHPVIVHTWVAAYLSTGEQQRLTATIDSIGVRHDLDWVFMELRRSTRGLPAVDSSDERHNVLVRVTYRSGVRSVDLLAVCHPHGTWINWR